MVGDRMARRTLPRMGLLLLAAAAGPTAGHGQGPQRLPDRDRVRLAEALRLADSLRNRVWPDWGRAVLSALLVRDSAEFLIGNPRPPADFIPLGHDALLSKAVWTRPRHFPPDLLATFPAVDGVPTIVIGSAERTRKSSTAWVLTVLHEHFHQWQYSRPGYYEGVAGLGLANGDTTGQWMLDYPFPYDSPHVQHDIRRFALALRQALYTPRARRLEALRKVVRARDALHRRLNAADYRYFEFQLWQEGVARYVEYAAARAAAASGAPAAQFRELADYVSYDTVASRGRRALRRELDRLDLGRQRRVAFYSIGAAIALLLEESRPDWKRAYMERPFALAALLPDSP
jgi:hypothetical protein